ncbi:MAG: AAA family ATPase [Candidatus Thermoplasmatota archaeon]|nr:AAA family ATPase [Candidatus Thermoplasmatota archaeon]
MHVIAFTGMPWSGKSEAVKAAIEKDIPVFRMGDMVWQEVKERGLPLNSENVGTIANEMRLKHGPNIWAKKIVDTIKEMTHVKPLVVIDGIRSIEELNYLRTHLSDSFLLIAITSPDILRHERAKKRKREDDSIQDSDIQERDNREKQWGIETVMASADQTICNDSTLESFREKISTLF